MAAWWQENHFDLQLSKRARWFIGYASAPAVVRPDHRREIPVWEPRDTLSAYPAPTSDPLGLCPADCIFAVQRSLGWISSHFGKAAKISRRPSVLVLDVASFNIAKLLKPFAQTLDITHGRAFWAKHPYNCGPRNLRASP